MLALFLITTVLLFGGLSEAIDSENGTWLLGHPIRSGLPKWSRGRDIQGNILLHFIYFHILTNSLLLGEKRLITFCATTFLRNAFITLGINLNT